MTNIRVGKKCVVDKVIRRDGAKGPYTFLIVGEKDQIKIWPSNKDIEVNSGDEVTITKIENVSRSWYENPKGSKKYYTDVSINADVDVVGAQSKAAGAPSNDDDFEEVGTDEDLPF